MTNEAVILSAVRTPMGRFQGSLSCIPATRLGAVVVKAAVEERWMLVAHPGYQAYRARTKRFVPGVI